jgi:predicted ATPase
VSLLCVRHGRETRISNDFSLCQDAQIRHSLTNGMIKTIKIRDFKSIREVELELDPVTVLVGRSGTGKSNLVQAIRFLRNILLDFNEAIQYERGWPHISPVGATNPKTSIEVSFSVPGEEQDFNYCIGFGNLVNNPSARVLTEERLSLGKEQIFSRQRNLNNAWAWGIIPKVSPLPHVGHDTPMLGVFPSLQKVVFANAALSTGIGYYHFPSTTLSFLSPQQHGQNFLQKIPGLSDNAANYREVMRGITQDFHHPNIRKNLMASLQAVNPSIVSVELDSLTNPSRAIIAHKAAGQVFELSLEQESDGLRRFYAHLLALYQTPSKLALVFEEPENAIFPGALSLLADEFKAAPRENRGQVILTTHNPIFLDSFDVDNVRAVDMQDGKTIVGRVSKEQRQAVKDKLLTTGDLLTVDRAKLDDTAKPQQ